MTANLPGIVNSALLTYAADPDKRPMPDLSAYEQLGAAFRQLSMMQQQMQQMGTQQPQAPGMIGPEGGSLGVQSSGSLTSGFDPNWLSKQYHAGSADGATIGKGGGGGGKQEDPMDNPFHPGRDSVTQRDYSKMAGASRLQSGFWAGTKDLFGWGKGNKIGWGR